MNRKNFNAAKVKLASLLHAQAKFNRIDLVGSTSNYADIFPFLPEDVGEQIVNFGNKILDEEIIDTASELLTAAYDYVEKGTENGLFGGEINYDTSRHNTDDDKQ